MKGGSAACEFWGRILLYGGGDAGFRLFEYGRSTGSNAFPDVADRGGGYSRDPGHFA